MNTVNDIFHVVQSHLGGESIGLVDTKLGEQFNGYFL